MVARRARRRRAPGAGLASATAPGASRSPAATTASRVRGLAALVDFVGPHVYRMEDRPRPPAPTARRSSASWPRCPASRWCWRSSAAPPTSSSDDNAAHYYRQVLHNSRCSAGATGWIAWNNTDYDDCSTRTAVPPPPVRDALRASPTPDGTPKPPLLELRRFAGTLDAVDLPAASAPTPTPPSSCSSVLEGGIPVHPCPTTGRRLRHAGAGVRRRARGRPAVRPSCARPTASPSGYRLYLVPSAKQLTGPGWHRLRRPRARAARPSTSRTARGRTAPSAAPGSRH